MSLSNSIATGGLVCRRMSGAVATDGHACTAYVLVIRCVVADLARRDQVVAALAAVALVAAELEEVTIPTATTTSIGAVEATIRKVGEVVASIEVCNA